MSKAADINLWGIHAGKTGAPESLLLKKNCIAAGWTKMDRSDCEKAAIKHTIYVNRQALTVSPVSYTQRVILHLFCMADGSGP